MSWVTACDQINERCLVSRRRKQPFTVCRSYIFFSFDRLYTHKKNGDGEASKNMLDSKRLHMLKQTWCVRNLQEDYGWKIKRTLWLLVVIVASSGHFTRCCWLHQLCSFVYVSVSSKWCCCDFCQAAAGTASCRIWLKPTHCCQTDGEMTAGGVLCVLHYRDAWTLFCSNTDAVSLSSLPHLYIRDVLWHQKRSSAVRCNPGVLFVFFL